MREGYNNNLLRIGLLGYWILTFTLDTGQRQGMVNVRRHIGIGIF